MPPTPDLTLVAILKSTVLQQKCFDLEVRGPLQGCVAVCESITNPMQHFILHWYTWNIAQCQQKGLMRNSSFQYSMHIGLETLNEPQSMQKAEYL